MYFLLCLLLLCISSQTNLVAVNALVARVPDNYNQYPAYIENAVLTAEPHGGYMAQTLTFEYADHGAFPGSYNVEIIHRFELPEGSVVNDLYLWIDNVPVKANMLSTWTARAIYDSIVSMKRDPAFLSRVGNQYELHVYPLVSGSSRKVKISFITPTKWSGATALCELPYLFLCASGATSVPVDISFISQDDVWGTPAIYELNLLVFTVGRDSTGAYVGTAHLDNVKTLNSLKISFSCGFKDGVYFTNNVVPGDDNYFQVGIIPWRVFSLSSIESISQKKLVALDLSGAFNKNFSTLLPNLKSAIKAGMHQNDKFNIIAAGAGMVKMLLPEWKDYNTDTLDKVLDDFVSSPFGDSVKQQKKPLITYCDDNAYLIWNFPDISNYAAVQEFSTLPSANPVFTQSDIVASYNHGHERVLSDAEAATAIASLDSLFMQGGRFLGYYDMNRIGKEKIAKHYIPSLDVKYRTESAVTLKRNPSGNIGINFPESLVHNGGYFFIYSDSTVKAEMVDSAGNPCIISKRLGNGGLLVVTGIWPFNDDIPMRKTLAIPLLGLNAISNNFQLINLLTDVAKYCNSDSVAEVFAFSNCDSLVTNFGADVWVTNYLHSFIKSPPIFKTVNLLDGTLATPSSITISGTEYYGSGYLLREIADSTSGGHIETHLQDWTMVDALMKPAKYPVVEHITVSPAFANVGDSLKTLIEITPVRYDVERPLLFVGQTNSLGQTNINLDAKFVGITEVKHASFNYAMNVDTTHVSMVNASMVGYEKLKEKLTNTPTDTAGIIRQALKYNLLCDYTALIALDPKDSVLVHHNSDDPNSPYTTKVENSDKVDSLFMQIFPNPFNPSTIISVSVPNEATLNIIVYNILGKEVAHIMSLNKAVGRYRIAWNGRDDYGQKVASGVYLIAVRGKEISSGKPFFMIKKAMLLK